MEQKDLRDLIRLFDKSAISELNLRNGDFSIKLKKENMIKSNEISMPVVAAEPQTVNTVKVEETVSPSQPAEKTNENITTINSPMVGTFYKAPSPDASPFVNVGDTVKKGDPIAIIEAMKIMNELEAEIDCKILEILIENGQPVEYDMPIFRVEKL